MIVRPLVDNVFRHSRSNLAAAVVCAIGFAATGCFSVIVAISGADGPFPHPVEIAVAIFVCLFWAALFATSLFMIAAYFREQITLTSTTITRRGVFRTQCAEIANISQMSWCRTVWGDLVLVRTPHARLKICFGNFTERDRSILIAGLHEVIPADDQNGWSTFLEPRSKQPVRSRGIGIICTIPFLITCVATVYCWHLAMGTQFLVAAFASFVGVLWYGQRIRKFVSNA